MNNFVRLDDDLLLLIISSILLRHRSALAHTCRLFARLVHEALATDLSLDNDQLAAFLSVMNGDNVVITGSAGTGKSHVFRAIRKHIRPEGTVVAASTGCAAANVGAITFHSALGIGIAKPPSHVISTNILKERGRGHTLRDIQGLRTLIVDEAFMLTGELFQKAGEVVTLVRRGKSNEFNPNSLVPYDDVQIVLVGDPLQLAPVAVDTERWLWQSQAFRHLQAKTHRLSTVHRQANDAPFIRILQRARLGQGTQEDLDYLLSNSAQTPPDGALRLFALNAAADEYNKGCLSRIDATYHAFNALDSATDSEADPQILLKNCTAVKQLIIKEGARVICLKNIAETNVHNGSLGTVKKIDVFSFENTVHHVNISVHFDPLVGDENGYTHTFKTHIQGTEVARENLFKIEGANKTTLAQRIQIPLKLAYGISIHKSQGDPPPHCLPVTACTHQFAVAFFG